MTSSLKAKARANQTNVFMGEDPAEFTTSASDSFAWPAGAGAGGAQNSAASKARIRQTNWEMGTDEVDYRTTEKLSFSAKPAERTKPSTAALGCSIHFGEEKTNYTSTAKENYQGKAVTGPVAVGWQERREKLQKTNFSFGEDATQYETAASEQARTGASGSGAAAAEMRKHVAAQREILRRPNIDMGGDDVPYQTTQAASFGAPAGGLSHKEQVAAREQVKTQLRRNNVVLGEDLQHFTTESMDQQKASGSTYRRIRRH